MVRRRKSPQDQIQAYKRFAGMTLVGAGLIALASLDTHEFAHKTQEKGNDGTSGAVKTVFKVNTARQGFDMMDGGASGPLSPANDGVAQQLDGSGSAIASQAPQRSVSSSQPPPGDPAKLVGVQYKTDNAASPAQPTADQAARLIEQSRVRSGSANRGD